MKNKIIIYLMILFLLSSFATATYNLSENLMAYWDFEGDYLDSTPRNIDGSGTGTVNFSNNGKLGDKSLSFWDVTGSYAEFGNGDTMIGSTNPDEWSLSYWVYPKDFNSDLINFYDTLITQNYPLRTLTGTTNGINHFNTQTRQESSCGTGNCAVSMRTNNTNSTLNVWYHIVITMSKITGETYIYKNGELADSDTISQDTDFWFGSRLLMGNIYYQSAYNYPAYADLDGVGFWNVSLSEEDVLVLYNYGNGNPYPFQDATINFSIRSKNIYNNNIIYNFSAFINDTTYFSNISTGLLLTPYNSSRNYLFNITVSSPGYVTKSYINYNLTYLTLISYLSPTNSLNITIYNSSNLDILTTTNATITLDNDDDYYKQFITNTGNQLITNITPGNISLIISASGFQNSNFYLLITNTSTQNLKVYLEPISSDEVVFTFIDWETGGVISGVLLTVEKKINGTYYLVNSFISDVSGRVAFYYDDQGTYRFTTTHTNYQPREFSFNPIIFTSYNIRLLRSEHTTNSEDYAYITIQYDPHEFYNNIENNLTFIFASPYGEFESYKFNITATSGALVLNRSGSNAMGETLEAKLNISNATFNDKVIIEWSYTRTNGAIHNYKRTYSINTPSSGVATWIENQNNPFELSLFDRLIIMMAVLIPLVGVAFWFGGMPAGAILLLVGLGYFYYIGFISIWVIIISTIPLVLLLLKEV